MDIGDEIEAALNAALNIGDAFDIDPFADDIFALDAQTLQTDAQLPAPLKHQRRVDKRRFVMNLKRQALDKLITDLPAPDEDIYIISNGEGREGRMGATLEATGFDFGTFIPVLVDRLGKGCHCHCSTWVMNADHARRFVEMLDDGRLYALFIASDPFFKNKPTTAPIAHTLIAGLKRHEPRARFLAWKNHTKILCIANADKTRFVTITGSANLTAVQRAENYVMSGSPELYRFLVSEFFDQMMR
jgi:hypothetical protein